MPAYWSVPAMWRGETVVCLASGPSLTADDVAACRGRARIIAINDSYLLAPWADIHYFCDAKWYEWHRTYQSPAQRPFGRERALALFHGFQGLRVTLEAGAGVLEREPSIKVLRNDSQPREGRPHEPGGLCLAPDGVRTGRNSGYQAINLAAHTGARRIVLLGYDMRAVDGRSHWFGEHPQKANPRIYESTFIPMFATLIAPLDELAIAVVNCTPDSALSAFPKASLAEALCP